MQQYERNIHLNSCAHSQRLTFGDAHAFQLQESFLYFSTAVAEATPNNSKLVWWLGGPWVLDGSRSQAPGGQKEKCHNWVHHVLLSARHSYSRTRQGSNVKDTSNPVCPVNTVFHCSYSHCLDSFYSWWRKRLFQAWYSPARVCITFGKRSSPQATVPDRRYLLPLA